jgi:hypothetical protein
MSGQRFEELDRISGTNGAGLEHGSVEATQAPARRSMVAHRGSGIIQGALNAGAVDTETRARLANFGDLRDHAADPVTLATTKAAAIKTRRGDTFTERSIEKREPLSCELLDSFGSDQKEGLVRPSMHFWVLKRVAGDAAHRYFGFGDGALGQSAARDIELDDVGHSRQARSLPVHYRSKARRNVKELKNSSKGP